MNPVPENNQKIKKKRQSYSTEYKIAIAADLVPSHQLSLIPRSTIHGIKNYDFSKLIGHDMVIEKVQMLKNIAKHEEILRIGNAAIRVKNTIIKMMTALKSNKTQWHDMKKQIVNTIQRVKNTLGFDRALRYFKLSKSKFYSWYHQTKTECLETFTGFCPKIKPNQLTRQEVKTIKELTSDEKFKGGLFPQLLLIP